VLVVESPFTAILNRELYDPKDRTRRTWWQEQTAQASTVATVRRLGPLPPGAPPIETGICQTVDVGGSVSVTEMIRGVWSGSSLQQARQGLVQRGLLPGTDTIRRLRLAAMWWLPLVALGVARLVVGLGRDRPVGFLVIGLALTGFAVYRSLTKPTWAPKGKRLLSKAREEHRPLRMGARIQLASEPSGLVEPSVLATLALFGPMLLWNAQPGLAASLAAPAMEAGGAGGSSGAGGCGGGGCGGDGGCGG
jgi:uncharacterized protein (TIGR04222 family)